MDKANWKRRAYYGATIATMLALTAGFALATVNLGGANSSYQGSQTTTVSAVAGLNYVSTGIAVATSFVPTSCTPQSGACNVAASGATDCVSGTCASSDYIETITLQTVAGTAFPAPGTVAVTVYVTTTGGTTAGTTQFYSQTVTSNSQVNIVQMFDIGTVSSGPADVTSVTVVATVV
jgi:hypothetical protein